MKLNRSFNKYWVAIAAALLTAGGVAQNAGSTAATANSPASSSANQKNAQSGTGEPSARLDGRTALQVELSKGLDAKKAKPGDPVEARLTQDVKSDGTIVLHRGAKLAGHVSEVQARSKEHPESRLGIVFDKANGKRGEEFAFRAVVMALAPPLEGGPSNIAGDPTRLSSGPTMGGTPFGAGHAVGGPSASAAPAVEAATRGGTSGTLTAESRGAIDLPGVALRPSAVDGVQGTVIISGDRNVKLESGTQMMLLVSGGH